MARILPMLIGIVFIAVVVVNGGHALQDPVAMMLTIAGVIGLAATVLVAIRAARRSANQE